VAIIFLYFLYINQLFLGFLVGDVNLDKDGVRAAAVFAEMNIQLRKQGLSVVQQLDKIYKLYELVVVWPPCV
jgi:hypothetical protein